MIGEDFRSIAYNHYMKIKELEETIVCLRAEPAVLNRHYLVLHTKLRRETEASKMQFEEQRCEIVRLMKVIEGKDLEIEKLNERI